MRQKACVDCGAALRGHGTPTRCRSCSAKQRYIDKHGRSPEMIVAKCSVCGLEIVRYASNGRKQKLGEVFCSTECRAAFVGVHNSVSSGGDGKIRSKKEKDALYYRKNAGRIREHVKRKHHKTKAQTSEALKAKNRALKVEVMDAYGGKCACCGESTLEFLTIDHVNGDGHEHRKSVGKGKNIYRDIKRQGFPQDGRYQVLCFNCNIALGFYGYCPHRPEIKREFRGYPKNPGRPRTVA